MPDLPEPIDISKSNEYMLINRAIRARLKTWAIIEIHNHRRNLMNAALPHIPFDADGFFKAENFISDLANAFVFRKEDFDRFFTGDPTDQNLQFTHCMIVVGALKDDVTDEHGVVVKKRGEQTVLIAGCTPLKTDPTKYITTSDGVPGGPHLSKIATEHPPKAFKVTITDPNLSTVSLRKKLTNDNFLLAEEDKKDSRHKTIE